MRKALTPVLESASKKPSMGGRFTLVKNSTLTTKAATGGAFGIRSIPTCILMKGGQPVDRDGRLRPRVRCAPLNKHLPSEQALAAQEETHEARGRWKRATPQLRWINWSQALAADPPTTRRATSWRGCSSPRARTRKARATLAPALARHPAAAAL